MASVTVTVTEFSRSLSEFLSQVQYQGQVLDIARGKRVIARVSPVAAAEGFPVAQLDALFANGPKLGADGEAMAKDVSGLRATLRNRKTAWQA
jgi:antitoxin (DNA-binding transcriptional repressor) of toxin-antitoxin stability system